MGTWQRVRLRRPGVWFAADALAAFIFDDVVLGSELLLIEGWEKIPHPIGFELDPT